MAIAWGAFLVHRWNVALESHRYLRALPKYFEHLQEDWTTNTLEIEIVGFGDVPVVTNHRAHSFLFRPVGGAILAMPAGKDLFAPYDTDPRATMTLRGRSRHGLYSSRGWGHPARLDTRAHLVLHPLGWSPYGRTLTSVPRWIAWRIVAFHATAMISVATVAWIPATWIPMLLVVYACAQNRERPVFEFVSAVPEWKTVL